MSGPHSIIRIFHKRDCFVGHFVEERLLQYYIDAELGTYSSKRGDAVRENSFERWM